MCLTTLLNPCTPLSTPISPSANCTMLTQTPLLTLCHCTSPSCLITLSLILFAHIWLALSVNLSHPIHLPIKTSTLLLWFKGSLWWFSTPGQQKPPLTLDDLYNHLSRFLSHNNMLSCSLPCSLWASLTCYACGSSLSLPPPLCTLQQRPHGGMMSVSTSTSFSFIIPQSKTVVIFEGNQVVIQKNTTAPDPFVVPNN